MQRTRILVSVTCAAALAAAIPGAASATRSDEVNPNCFGKGASQIARAMYEFEDMGGMGEHSSTQNNPRSGIGNLVGGDDSPFVHQSELAQFLGAHC